MGIVLPYTNVKISDVIRIRYDHRKDDEFFMSDRTDDVQTHHRVTRYFYQVGSETPFYVIRQLIELISFYVEKEGTKLHNS